MRRLYFEHYENLQGFVTISIAVILIFIQKNLEIIIIILIYLQYRPILVYIMYLCLTLICSDFLKIKTCMSCSLSQFQQNVTSKM